MKSYKGKVKPDGSRTEQFNNRSSFLNFFKHVDREIDEWVNHLITEIESLKQKKPNRAGG